jgi:iron complex outermembrane receptor protein
VLGRWTHNFSDTSQLNLQMYYDHSDEEELSTDIKNDTYDFDLQHRFAVGTRNDIVWGAGYRYLTIETTPNFFVALTPSDEQEQLFSAFIQDEITLVRDRLHLTLGTKLEHNPYTGFEVEPSARLAWTPTEKQTVWAAVSRAVRTPFDFEQNIRENRSYNPPVLVSVFGNPNLNSEELIAYELGYRIKPIEPLSFDVTAFYNVYNQLIEPVQGAPFFEPPAGPLVVPLTYENVSRAETYGAEVLGEWRVTGNWKLTASYSLLLEHQTPRLGYDTDPQNQFQIHSYIDLPHRIELDGAVYYVAQITPVAGAMTTTVPSYVRVDFGVTWRPVKSLELGIFGQNLADNQHSEFTSYTTAVVTQIPRSVMARITWHF